MRERILVRPRPDWTQETHHSHALAIIRTKDGRKFRKEADYARMTEKDMDVKFSYLVGLRAGSAKAKQVAAILKRLDTLDNIGDLMVQLELPAVTIDQV